MRNLGHIGKEPISNRALLELSEFTTFKSLRLNEDKSFAEIQILWIDLSVIVDETFLNSFPSLEIIVTCTTGLTHINLSELRRRNVQIVSLKNHVEFLDTISSSSEHAWALLMAANTDLVNAHKHVESGEWSREQFSKNQLSGRRLGIIGFGRIGRQVSRYAQAFKMTVCAYDNRSEISVPMGVERFKDLDSLLELSDFILLSASVTDENSIIIKSEQLKNLKTGAVLINISRGCLVDEMAVADALSSKKLAFYATDVLSFEDFRYAQSNDKGFSNPFSKISNTIVTPHIGGFSVDARTQCELHLLQVLREGKCDCRNFRY